MSNQITTCDIQLIIIIIIIIIINGLRL